jgi:hypothetical protein
MDNGEERMAALIALFFIGTPFAAQMIDCTQLPTGAAGRGEGLMTTPGTDCILMWSDDTLFRVLPDGSVEMRGNGAIPRPMPDKDVRPSDVKKDQRPPRLD